jgi:hypothetical protein
LHVRAKRKLELLLEIFDSLLLIARTSEQTEPLLLVSASGVQTRSPKKGRILVPIPLPAKAAANQTQPWTLDEAMPLKYAPMLQP